MSRLIVLFALAFSNTASAQAVHFVDVDDFMFTPSAITIIDGDSVEWGWVGLANHSSTAAAGQSEMWDSGVVGNGSVFSHDFVNGTGLINYYCSPHGSDLGGGQVSGMSASVDVVPWSGLLMNEVLADPASGADVNCDGVADTVDDEFIEIVNTTGAAFDISGATVSDFVAMRHTFPANTVLEPGHAIVVFGGGTPIFDGTSPSTDVWCQDLDSTVQFQVASSGSLGLNNTGDTVTIADAGGLLYDTFGYGSEGGGNESLVHVPELRRGVPELHSLASADTWSPGLLADGSSFVMPPAGPRFASISPAIAGQSNQFLVSNGPASCNTVFIYGNALGAQAFPAGLCPGVELGIVGPTKFAEVMSDGNGDTMLNLIVPAAASGATVAVQAAYPCTCEVTNVVVTQFL